MRKYILWFIVFFVFIPAIAYSADINGLYPPMDIEPELLGPPKVEGMVYIKGGCFDMGDTFDEGENDEQPVHEVCVDDFYMGKFEVTQSEWKAVMEYNPSHFKGCGKCPVENVSWHDAQEYIKKLNRKTGRHYRLPSEAEWEYAARERGKRVRFGTGQDRIGPDEVNFDASRSYKRSYSRVGVYKEKTKPVGSFAPNSLGLYDMSGNVWEWVVDWYGEDYYMESTKDNPIGPSNGKARVLRGGSWNNKPSNVRAANRDWLAPNGRYYFYGFRVSLSANVQE